MFRHLWKEIGNNIHKYKSYPRIVGETGGKNFHVVHKSADIRSAVLNTIRAGFEYQGQKCSACSRVYVDSSIFPEFKRQILEEHAKIAYGPVEDFANFMGPVINRIAFDKIKSYITHAKSDPSSEIIAGGNCDDSVGYFVEPTIILTKDFKTKTMVEEIFGPVLTISTFDSADFESTLDIVDQTTQYALTGSIFARDRDVINVASNRLRNSAGNFYINDKCTGAVVGQQPFGGGRGSGTNDKAGSQSLLYRFVSARSIKENFLPIDEFTYPSNLV